MTDFYLESCSECGEALINGKFRATICKYCYQRKHRNILLNLADDIEDFFWRLDKRIEHDYNWFRDLTLPLYKVKLKAFFGLDPFA